MQLLLDKAEIHEALLRYCRGCDRCDEDLIRSAHHLDASFVRGPDVVRGADIAPDIIRSTNPSKTSLHTICNELVEVVRDVAYSETYWVSYSVSDKGDGRRTNEAAGRYLDRWERREDRRWKIARRVYILEWSRSDMLAQTIQTPRRFDAGLHSREDPSYQRLRSEVDGPG